MVALAPGARRRRVPFDPRVLIGILLVLGSVAGVVGNGAARYRSSAAPSRTRATRTASGVTGTPGTRARAAA